MSEGFDSVYPDLLKTGLGKLGSLDARRDLLSLFSALEHFRRELHAQENTQGILQVCRAYIAGLDLFHTAGFWLVNPSDFSFELALAGPDAARARLEEVFESETRSKRFAWALRQNSAVFFQSGPPEQIENGVFHSLSLSSQVVGMFCGLQQPQGAPGREIAFSLLSLLLGECADALATLRKTAQLNSQIETLSGLLPVCAWCKKVRNDDGYWEQIEKFLSVTAGASVTHGVCPDCRNKFLGKMAEC
ncbi:MAG: hypothetical protein U1F98_17875 [Verrucomicrobiota bacterium]